MRKYRAWHKEDKKMLWVYNMYSSFNDNLEPELHDISCTEVTNGNASYYGDFAPSEVILMQSTGLFDKNGKEIFEGDIVYLDDDYSIFGGLSGEHLRVFFKDGMYVLENKYNTKQWHTFHDALDNISISGNIYENKELIK